MFFAHNVVWTVLYLSDSSWRYFWCGYTAYL